MIRLSRPHYESDATRFIQRLKAERPGLESRQVEGRLLLWDQPPKTPDDRAREKAARVPQRPYVYHSGPQGHQDSD